MRATIGWPVSVLAALTVILYSRYMIERIASSVPAIAHRIDEIEHETESIYLRLGTVFQTIKVGVDSSANEAELTIRRILDQHRGGISAEAAGRRSREFMRRCDTIFREGRTC